MQKRITKTNSAEVSYEEMVPILKNCHFYPSLETSVGAKTSKTTGLIIDCPATFLMDDKKIRLEEILKEKGIKAVVHTMKNEGHLLIVKAGK